MSIDAEFFVWLDRAPPTGTIAFPGSRAKQALLGQALRKNVTMGRVVLWLWRHRTGQKAAFAMARSGGEGGEKQIWVELREPPIKDEEKAMFVLEKEIAK